jgi:hypothetical protein
VLARGIGVLARFLTEAILLCRRWSAGLVLGVGITVAISMLAG